MPAKGTPISRRPTLRTIAEATGLSLSTVSLALRGGTNLKTETLEKVTLAARELGYVPDTAGVRLRTGRSNTIGLILDGREDSVGFSRKLIQGVNTVVRSKGMALNVLPQFDRADTLETIEQLVRNGLVDGLILTHTTPQDARVKLLLEANLPFVTHGRTELFTPHPYHDFDTDGFFARSVAHLEEVGARRVMAVLADNSTFNHFKAREAFSRSILQSRLEGSIHDDQISERDHIGEMRALGHSLASRRDADAIICDSELVALSVCSGLREAGTEIGRTMRVASKQTSSLLPALFPEVFCLREDVQAAGEELARLLFARIGNAPITSLQTLSPPL